MGIKDFYKIVKQNAPEELRIHHLSEFCGHRWAVDISIFLNKYVKSSGSDAWMDTFFLFLCTLKKHGIKTVCIFDGPNPPEEKKAEQAKRRRDGKKAVDRMNRCKEIRKMLLRDYSPDGKLLEEDLQEECKVLYGKPKKKIRLRPIEWEDWTDACDALTSVIDSLEKQTAPITADVREKAKTIATLMGLPVFQADGEAEGLCAFMAIHGHVDGVLTEDTDVLAYGTPWLIAFKDFKLTDEKVFAIHLPSLRNALGYTQTELLDLCILLGCDYNKRDADGEKVSVMGFPPDGKKHKKAVSIGMVGALAFIEEYRTLENCLPYIENPELLIFERCREIFTPPSGRETLELIKIMPYNVRPDFDKVQEFMKENNLNTSIEYIKGFWKRAEIVFCSDSSSESEKESVSEVDDPVVKNVSMEHGDKFYVKLCVSLNDEDEEPKTAMVTVAFCSKAQFEDHEGTMFDHLIEPINAFLQQSPETEHCFVDDCIEIEQIIGTKKPEGKILYFFEFSS